MLKPTDIDRFKARYAEGDPSACWMWTGINAGGKAGQFRVDGRKISAYRFAWELSTGAPPPEDMLVVHTCGSRMCVNPAHLMTATRGEAGHIGGGITREAADAERKRGPARPEHVGWIAEHPHAFDLRLFRRRPSDPWFNVRKVYADLPAATATMTT